MEKEKYSLKNLDFLSCKMDLDFWDMYGERKILKFSSLQLSLWIIYYTGLSFVVCHWLC